MSDDRLASMPAYPGEDRFRASPRIIAAADPATRDLYSLHAAHLTFTSRAAWELLDLAATAQQMRHHRQRTGAALRTVDLTVHDARDVVDIDLLEEPQDRSGWTGGDGVVGTAVDAPEDVPTTPVDRLELQVSGRLVYLEGITGVGQDWHQRHDRFTFEAIRYRVLLAALMSVAEPDLIDELFSAWRAAVEPAAVATLLEGGVDPAVGGTVRPVAEHLSEDQLASCLRAEAPAVRRAAFRAWGGRGSAERAERVRRDGGP